MTVPRLLLPLLALVSALAVVLAGSPAGAASPGRNGAISYNHDGILVIDGVPHLSVYQPAPRDVYVSSAAWAPDGRRMAVVTQDPERLYVYDVDSQDLRLLGEADSGSKPSFSPDGRRLAVARGGDILVLDAQTGTVVRNLTPWTSTTREANPAWSPTDSGIAYDATDGVRIRPVAGGKSRLFARNGRYADFAPDGTKISWIDRSTTRLHYAKPDGTSAVRTAVDVAAASWSPDGTRFVVTGDAAANCLVTRLTGRIVERLADAVCTSPGWQPLH